MGMRPCENRSNRSKQPAVGRRRAWEGLPLRAPEGANWVDTFILDFWSPDCERIQF